MNDIDPYEVTIGGVKADPMRICRAYGITDMGVQQAIKKLLRSGRKNKTSTEDKREAITSLQRSVEMDEEDKTGDELENIKAILANPNAVRLNMLRGTIAWTPETLRHVLGDAREDESDE